MARGIKVTTKVDKKSIPNVLRPTKARALIQGHIAVALDEILQEGKRIAQELTPVGGTGQLKGSVATTVALGRRLVHEGSVAWTAPYAATVDRGGPARKVNIGKLNQWAATVLGDESLGRAVQAGIQLRGTPSPNHPNPGLGMSGRLSLGLQPRATALFLAIQNSLASKLESD